MLTCPNDFSVVEGKGNLSFVVNAGFAWTIPVDCPATMHLTADNVLRVVPFDLNGNLVMCPLDPASDGTPSDRASIRLDVSSCIEPIRTRPYSITFWAAVTADSLFKVPHSWRARYRIGAVVSGQYEVPRTKYEEAEFG